MTELHEMGYDELNDHVKDAIKEMRRKAYAEGYRQGKFDAQMDDVIQDAKLREISETILTPEKLAKLDQKKRDEIVAKAKADVGKLSRNGFSFNSVGDKRLVKYTVNKDKRTVVALLSGYLSGIIYERGIAKCDPSDCFNVHIGKAIALRRALGLDLPSYYLNVPQPTSQQAGDKIRMKYYNPDITIPDKYYDKTIDVIESGHVRYKEGGFDFLQSVERTAKVTDDSRE